MKSVIICFIVLTTLISNFASSQNTCTVGDNNRVTNFNAQFSFTHSCIWDYDIRQSSHTVESSSTIIIKTNEYGFGKLILYFAKKNIFNVEDCTAINGGYKLTLSNDNGAKFDAYIEEKSAKTKAFRIDNPNNTATVFYNVY